LVLRLNPCLGGAKANQGFTSFNFESDVFPSASAVAISSVLLNPISEISSGVIFLYPDLEKLEGFEVQELMVGDKLHNIEPVDTKAE